MSLSPDEAAKALDEIAAAERVSRAAYDYLIGGAYLMVWGVVWLICFGLIDLALCAPQLIWAGGCAAAIIASVILGRGRRRAAGLPRWRALIPSGSYVGFAFLALEIVPPHRVEQASAFVALVLALAYIQMGIQRGDRLMLVGFAIAVLTLAGYWSIPVHYNLYMAVIGGSSLILTGYWLRRA
jgi:hypothetical protein